MIVNSGQKIYALVDCNAFFCSCERLFRPDLIGKPVGVLSNNDGCFVSRTKELKLLGVKMGEPYFKVKELCKEKGVHVFSANFSLYTNLSDRVMSILSLFAPEIEVYSVDEAFLDLTQFSSWDLQKYAREIKSSVERNTGIPVCVGIGTSKTMAKLANHIAKKSSKSSGVVVLLEKKLQDIALARVDVSDIWGVGKKSALKCRYLGINTALDFRDYKNSKLLQKIFTKTGKRIQDELRGESCFELTVVAKKKKEILSSRSFGEGVYDLTSLRESVATYISTACEKLRDQNSVCSQIEVFCRTSVHKNNFQYSGHDKYKLMSSSSDTRTIIKYAWNVLDDLYKSGFEYKKSGIKLAQLEDKNEYQLSLISQCDSKKSEKLMEVMDQINKRDGRGTVRSMACGTDNKSYKMRQEMKSPRYLIGWGDLRKVN